jgi:hypothetical protein
VNGGDLDKLYILILIFALTTGCSMTGSQSDSKVKLVGVKSVQLVPASGPVERVYFISVDSRENKTLWNSYPEKLDIWPGKHIVVVACEWRPTATAPPNVKSQRRIEDTFEAGHIYKFKSTLEINRECSISYEDVTIVKSD